MSEFGTLRVASVQDIQLELIRRTRFNDLDGERVVASLLRQRRLWLAVLLDRPGLPNFSRPGRLLTAGLLKLRDLPDDCWNADTLFVLTPTKREAEELAELAEADEWGGEVRVYDDQNEIDDALGTGRQPFGLVTVWWD